jgi:hypothetical protein
MWRYIECERQIDLYCSGVGCGTVANRDARMSRLLTRPALTPSQTRNLLDSALVVALTWADWADSVFTDDTEISIDSEWQTAIHS